MDIFGGFIWYYCFNDCIQWVDLILGGEGYQSINIIHNIGETITNANLYCYY